MDFFAGRLKGGFVYTIGGYLSGELPTARPRVFGNATGKRVVDGFKGTKVVFGESRGAIWGAAGMLLAFAKMRKLDGICLLGETTSEIDASAAKAVAEVLSQRLHLKISTEGMDKLIRQTEAATAALQKQLSAQEDDKNHKLSYIR
jgi:hypothetical protein